MPAHGRHVYAISECDNQGLFKPAEAPKNMAPIDTATTAVALSSESAQGNHLSGYRELRADPVSLCNSSMKYFRKY
jgi:hypothetical protein